MCVAFAVALAAGLLFAVFRKRLKTNFHLRHRIPIQSPDLVHLILAVAVQPDK